MGTGSTLTIKIAYSLNGTDSIGNNRPFEKPLSTTFVMFVAMSCSLPIYFLIKAYRYCGTKHSHSNTSETINSPLITNKENEESPKTTDQGLTTRLFFLLLVPASFDLLGTAIAKAGLMYCDVSTYQLVRCTVIVFTALAKTCMGQHLPRHVWAGVGLITTAMIFVSTSSLLQAADDKTQEATSGLKKDPKIGIVFLMFSCMVASLQYVFEEKVMADDGAHPLIVVGMEGFWGVFLFVTCVFPWAYIIPGNDVGSLENVYDSWIMAKSSLPLQYSLWGFFITVALYNIFAVYLTHLMSSVWHAILDCFRPVSVWGTDLLIFYAITNGTFGEAWTNWSYLQLTGMLLLFLGTAVFNGNVQCRCCPVPLEEKDDQDDYDTMECDPSTPIYFINNGPNGMSPFRTPRTHTQHKQRTPTSNDFCRSPLLSRSAARRAYQERTVVGFSDWVNGGNNGNGGVSSHVVVHSGLSRNNGILSDPTAVTRMYRQQKTFRSDASSGSMDNTTQKREFGRDVSNHRDLH